MLTVFSQRIGKSHRVPRRRKHAFTEDRKKLTISGGVKHFHGKQRNVKEKEGRHHMGFGLLN